MRHFLALTLAFAASLYAQTAGNSAIVVSRQQIEATLKQKLAGAPHEFGGGLFDGTGFRIGALKRALPGEAEVHLKDTDIFYMLSGSATLVTGGEVVGEHAISAIEERGTSIRNGVRHELAAGDVVVIPKQQPHWFQNVSAGVSYIVIKVE
ncbi:MAG: hypothetical protein JOY62_15245 [Acidobacteriaceae bacterium]|nr:hypothetical protein [Acidobacteriaceae bacterium]MBV9781318.1 hypothetical protein [Acidobacteriaceae bacterium]